MSEGNGLDLRTWKIARSFVLFLAFTAFLAEPARLFAQEELARKAVAAAEAAFSARKYKKAVDYYREAITATRDAKRKVEFRVLVAWILNDFLPDSAGEAKLEVRDILAAEPDHDVDPEFTSPKFKKFFDDVKTSFKGGGGKPVTAADVRKEAQQKITDGKYDEAIYDLKAAADRFPNDAEIYKLLSTANEKAGHNEAALETLKRALEIEKSGSAVTSEPLGGQPTVGGSATAQPSPAVSTQDLISQGIDARQKGDRSGAVGAFRRAVDSSPNNADARNYLGLSLFENGQAEEAVAEYQRALQISESHQSARANLGAAFISQRRFPEAIEQFKRVVANDKSNVDGFLQLGFALRETNHSREAAEAFRNATNLAPTNEKAWNNLGICLFETNDLDEAINAYREALKIKSDYQQAVMNLALALTKKGDYDGAEKAWRELLDKDPGNLRAATGLARLMLKKERLTDAIELSRGALKTDANNIEALNTLGLALKAAGKLPDALETFQKAAEVAPDRAEIQNNLGLLYYDTKQYAKAVEAFEKALALKPDFTMAKENLKLAQDVLRAESDSKRAP